MRKPVFGVSDQVRHKLGCTATEGGYRGLKISDRKIPKFSDARKLCCNPPKIQTKRLNLRVFRQKDANGIENSEDPDQTAPREAV